MINNLNILFPEIFLSLSVFSILMIGVFIKNSFNLIFNLTSIIIVATILIILTSPSNKEKIFLDSFMRDAFSNYFKILILLSSLFVLNSSKSFILDNKLDKFEYPIIILLSMIMFAFGFISLILIPDKLKMDSTLDVILAPLGLVFVQQLNQYYQLDMLKYL